MYEIHSGDKQRAMDRFELHLTSTIKNIVKDESYTQNAGQDAALGNRKIFTLLLAVQLRQVLMLQRRQGHAATDTPRFHAIAHILVDAGKFRTFSCKALLVVALDFLQTFCITKIYYA